MNLGNRHSQHSFAQIPSVNTARSVFDRSFTVKDTFDFDYLVPMFADEVLPGDTINMNLSTFARLAPQVRPVMDNMFLDFFWFFVPNRLVWNNWERFMGAQDDPGDSTDYLVPQLTPPVAGWLTNSIADHFGIPTGVEESVNVLPFRGYNLIFNEWFRDQNLVDSVNVPKTDGPDSAINYQLLKRAKPHDYFTSALPFAQKGAAVTIPLGTTAPVITTNVNPEFNLSGTDYSLAVSSGHLVLSGTSGSGAIAFGAPTGLQADLTTATAATINALRQAFMYQSLLELDARGGTRYIEILKAHFNVISPDFRLQRPEFLASSSTVINQHPIAQSSSTTDDSPQGNLAAFSTQSTQNQGFSKSFVEHGWVIGMMQARGQVTYQQGLNKKWSRTTKNSYFWPKLQELGEQTILNKEIYCYGTTNQRNAVFGYQERFAEYRYSPSEIRGQFRSDYAQTLDVWHLAEEFGALPVLNESFIESSTPIARALVVPDVDYPDILIDMFFDYKHARPMMTYGVPASLGRF